METLPVIAARQLAIGYSHGKNGSTVVHRDLSFDLWAGELTCLLGRGRQIYSVAYSFGFSIAFGR